MKFILLLVSFVLSIGVILMQLSVGYAEPHRLPNGTPSNTLEPSAARQYEQARALNLASRPAAAIRLLENIILTEEEDAITLFRAYFLRGQIWQNNGEFEQALRDYTEALALQPSIANVYAFRASVYFELAEYELALSDYTEAIFYDDSEAQYYLARGIILGQIEDYDAALDDFSEALRLDDELWVAYRERGLAARAIDNNAQAIEDLNTYLDGLPSAPDSQEINEILAELG